MQQNYPQQNYPQPQYSVQQYVQQPPPGWAYHPQHGWYQVVQQQPQTAVTYRRKDTAHAAHIILSFATGGVWFFFVYGPLLLIRALYRQKQVTHYQ